MRPEPTSGLFDLPLSEVARLRACLQEVEDPLARALLFRLPADLVALVAADPSELTPELRAAILEGLERWDALGGEDDA